MTSKSNHFHGIPREPLTWIVFDWIILSIEFVFIHKLGLKGIWSTIVLEAKVNTLSLSKVHMLGRKRRQEDHYTSPINNLHLNYNLRFHLTRNPSPDHQPRDEPKNNSNSLWLLQFVSMFLLVIFSLSCL